MDEQQKQDLIDAAIAARQSAYAPYSDFRVGAAILTKDGHIFSACNVENASFGLSICAEQVAICSAVSAGHQKFAAVAVAASPLASPCGACRQFIVEFGLEITVVSVDAEDADEHRTWTSNELIPNSFEL